MKKMNIHILKELIKSTYDNFEFECDYYEKTAVIALLVNELCGFKILSLSLLENNIYFNDDNGTKYKYDSIGTLNYDNNQEVDRNELLQNPVIKYNYVLYKIEILKEYKRKIIIEQNAVNDYINLKNIYPFFNKLKQKSYGDVEFYQCAKNVLKDVEVLSRKMEKNYLNVQLYLEIDNELEKTQNEYHEFKKSLLLKKI